MPLVLCFLMHSIGKDEVYHAAYPKQTTTLHSSGGIASSTSVEPGNPQKTVRSAKFIKEGCQATKNDLFGRNISNMFSLFLSIQFVLNSEGCLAGLLSLSLCFVSTCVPRHGRR